MTMDPTCEEILLNQWQPLQTILYDGWVLRFADGYTKRANSVNPIYYSNGDIHKKIKHCEKMYAAHQLKTIFKITPFMHPENLDDILETEGYAAVDPTSAQRLDLRQVKPPTLQTIRIDEHVNDEWIDQFCLLNSVDEKHKQTMKRMQSNRCSEKGFFTLYHNGEIAACGLGIVERKALGLFDIITSHKFRNQGLGEQLILNILHWGKDQGAAYSDLAVLLNNIPALRLYAKLGYKEMYSYWYRVK